MHPKTPAGEVFDAWFVTKLSFQLRRHKTYIVLVHRKIKQNIVLN
jgi:hypothetical protein